MGWMETVRDGIYRALCAAFRLEPESQEGLTKFVPAYVENTITPQAPRDIDVCYFNVESYPGDNSLDYVMLNVTGINDGAAKMEIKKTIPCSVLITFYGPNADDEAEFFWSIFQWDNGVGSPRSVLRDKRIVPIGTPNRPVSLYEVEGTYQRRRCDVRVNLAYLEVSEFDVSEVEVAPEIGVQSQLNN